jgi:hypothetical protein
MSTAFSIRPGRVLFFAAAGFLLLLVIVTVLSC